VVFVTPEKGVHGYSSTGGGGSKEGGRGGRLQARDGKKEISEQTGRNEGCHTSNTTTRRKRWAKSETKTIIIPCNKEKGGNGEHSVHSCIHSILHAIARSLQCIKISQRGQLNPLLYHRTEGEGEGTHEGGNGALEECKKMIRNPNTFYWN
jgi:hypothetical protein